MSPPPSWLGSWLRSLKNTPKFKPKNTLGSRFFKYFNCWTNDYFLRRTSTLRLPVLSSLTSSSHLSPLSPLYFLNRWLLNHSTNFTDYFSVVNARSLSVLTRRRINSPKKKNVWLFNFKVIKYLTRFPLVARAQPLWRVTKISAKMRLVNIWKPSFIFLPCLKNPRFTNSCFTNPSHVLQILSNHLLQYVFLPWPNLVQISCGRGRRRNLAKSDLHYVITCQECDSGGKCECST